MTKRAYLPTTLVLDERQAFVSHLIKEVAGAFGSTLQHATTKHVQLSGLHERSQASIKQALKIETGELRSLWDKRLTLLSLTTTLFITQVDCEPSKVFQRRIPYNVLDSKLGIRLRQAPIPTSQIAQVVLDQTELMYQDVRKNAM